LSRPEDFQSEQGLLCRVSYWDGSATDLYYFANSDFLSHIVNPGDAWFGFSYDTLGRIVSHHDPVARDVALAGVRTDTDLGRLFTQIAYDGERVASVTAPAAAQTDTQRAQHSRGPAGDGAGRGRPRRRRPS